MKPLLIYITLIFTFFSCKTEHPKKTPVQQKENPIIQIRFERTACYGKCPVFSLSLNPDNTAYFEGIKYVAFTGKGEARLPSGTFERFKCKLDSMQVKKLRDRYTRNLSDNPTAYLSVLFEDFSVKKIEDYGLRGTPELEELYRELTGIALTTDWKPVKDE